MSKRLVLDVAAMADRLSGHLDRATVADVATGSGWYADTGREAKAMAQTHDFPIEVAAAVISHLSPQTRYVDNVTFAWQTLADPGERPAGCIGDNYQRARKAIVAHWANEDPLATFGPQAHKTRAFAAAILGDPDAVVVDTWMIRAALHDTVKVRGQVLEASAILRRRGVYQQVAEAIAWASARHGVRSAVGQAIIWGVVRGTFD